MLLLVEAMCLSEVLLKRDVRHALIMKILVMLHVLPSWLIRQVQVAIIL